MKKLLVILALFVDYNLFGQEYKPEYILRQVFYDSISRDHFLIKQRYADIKVSGFLINATSDILEVDPTTWVYCQDFSQYLDTSKYHIIYEAISYENGFHYEYFVIYSKITNKFIRQLAASYEIGSNRLVGLMDSEISF